jgi:hypothetical protein
MIRPQDAQNHGEEQHVVRDADYDPHSKRWPKPRSAKPRERRFDVRAGKHALQSSRNDARDQPDGDRDL